MRLTFTRGAPEDAGELAALRTAAAEQLGATFGPGPWSSPVTVDLVRRALATRWVLVARSGASVIATLRLQRRKAWAIDTSPFSLVPRPLYLVDMAVDPDAQRQGVGRRCLAEAERVARLWPADAIRLDAYASPAGAGAFYLRCGYREVMRAGYAHPPRRFFELLLP